MNIKEKCIKKLKCTAERIQNTVPFITENGKYCDYSDYEHIDGWANSFWAGILWLLFDETGEEKYKNWAIDIEEKLTAPLYEYKRLYHDLGFLWLLTGVEHYKHTGDENAKNKALLAASVLSSRFNLKGNFIRAWNGSEHKGKAIIDCMMNLPLLCWASYVTGDNRFENVAKAHSDMAMKHFIRENGSVKHIIEFDTETGEYLKEHQGQGAFEGSEWTRGQSWGIYGFIQGYEWTKEEKYLHAALKIADHFIEQAEKFNFRIPCDFCQSETDLYDASAAAAVSCGLIEIYKVVKNEKYLNAAEKILEVCDKEFAPWDDENDEALLNFCCEAYFAHKHVALIYGDYYFFKASCEMEKLKTLTEF